MRRSVAAVLVLVLLVQILPFTFDAPAGGGDGAVRYTLRVESLQVCDSDDIGGVLADYVWLPAPAAPFAADTLMSASPPAPPFVLPQRYPRRLLRPPRA